MYIYIYIHNYIFKFKHSLYIYIYWYHHDNRNHDDDDGDDDDDDPMGQQSTSNLKVSQSDLGPTAGAAMAGQAEDQSQHANVLLSPGCIYSGGHRQSRPEIRLLALVGMMLNYRWIFSLFDMGVSWYLGPIIHFFLWFSTKKNIDLGVAPFMETPIWCPTAMSLLWVVWCEVRLCGHLFLLVGGCGQDCT